MSIPYLTTFPEDAAVASSEGPSPLDYNATLQRMEDGIAPVEPSIALASIAISLKDISVTLTAMYNTQIANQSEARWNAEKIQNAINSITFTHNRSS